MRLLRQSFQSFPRNHRGATLVELLVVFGLITLISAILIGIVSHSSALVSQGTTAISLNQKARTVLDRLQPYLATAVDSGGSTRALVSPMQKNTAPTTAELDSYQEIRFTSTENFLDPNYDARDDWQPWTPDAYHYFEIAFDVDTRPTSYTLANGNVIKLGQVWLREYQDAGFTTLKSGVTPQPIAHNVQHFRCHVLTSQNLEVICHTVGKRKGPAGNLVDVFEEAHAIISTPSETYY